VHVSDNACGTCAAWLKYCLLQHFNPPASKLREPFEVVLVNRLRDQIVIFMNCSCGLVFFIIYHLSIGYSIYLSIYFQKRGCSWHIAMASGWESKGLGFEPWPANL